MPKTFRARAVAVLVALFLLRCGPEPTTPTPRLVLIGVDGGSWNLVDPMLAAGRLPNLGALRDRGVTAELTGLLPLLSPALWTSIATGTNPQTHGVRFFYDNRLSIQVPTVWERLAAAGLRVGLYDYLVTWPPRDLPGGFVVPAWLRRDDRVTPPDLFERAGLPAYAYSLDGVDGPEAILEVVARETADKARYWNRLSEALEPDVGAVIFYSVDAVCHRFWHAAFPDEFESPEVSPIAADARYRDVIHDTLEAVDRAIGEIVAELRPEDHVVVVSDHGFQAQPQGFLRVWDFHAPWLLARAGIDPERNGVSMVTEWRSLVFKVEPGAAEEREPLTRQVQELLATVRDPSGAPVFETFTVHPQTADAAIPEDLGDYADFARRLIQRFEPAHAFIFARPVQARLDPAPGAEIEVAGERYPLARLATSHEFAGAHHPTGIFLAAGSAFRPRTERTRLSVIDVAPLLTYLAGQPIPDDLEGQLREALFDPDHLRRIPPRSVPAAEAPSLNDGDQRGGAADEDSELRKRLEALGYV